jgi:hypothetical protein
MLATFLQQLQRFLTQAFNYTFHYNFMPRSTNEEFLLQSRFSSEGLQISGSNALGQMHIQLADNVYVTKITWCKCLNRPNHEFLLFDVKEHSQEQQRTTVILVERFAEAPPSNPSGTEDATEGGLQNYKNGTPAHYASLVLAEDNCSENTKYVPQLYFDIS